MRTYLYSLTPESLWEDTQNGENFHFISISDLWEAGAGPGGEQDTRLVLKALLGCVTHLCSPKTAPKPHCCPNPAETLPKQELVL